MIAEGPKANPEAEVLRQNFLAAYKDTVFDIKVCGPPTIRCPFGEASIKLKPGSIPKKQRPYQILGDRKVRFKNKIRQFEEETGGWRMVWGHGVAQSSRFPSRTTTGL